MDGLLPHYKPQATYFSLHREAGQPSQCKKDLSFAHVRPDQKTNIIAAGSILKNWLQAVFPCIKHPLPLCGQSSNHAKVRFQM